MDAVLLQLDPSKAIEVADKLAGGNERLLLAIGLVFAVIAAVALATLLWKSWQAHLAEVRTCGDRYADMLGKKIESDTRLAAAIEGSNQVNRAAMDALRGIRP